MVTYTEAQARHRHRSIPAVRCILVHTRSHRRVEAEHYMPRPCNPSYSHRSLPECPRPEDVRKAVRPACNRRRRAPRRCVAHSTVAPAAPLQPRSSRVLAHSEAQARHCHRSIPAVRCVLVHTRSHRCVKGVNRGPCPSNGTNRHLSIRQTTGADHATRTVQTGGRTPRSG